MFSIAAHGHVNPSIEVIRELVARGHRVTYAIPPAFADKVAETGAEPKLWNSTLPTDDDPDASNSPVARSARKPMIPAQSSGATAVASTSPASG